MTPVRYLYLLIIVFLSACNAKEKSSQWRGPDRNGIYQEKDLLQSWTESGPEMIWSWEGLGYGHGSPAILNDKVYLTGIKDTVESMGTLFVFDKTGDLLWEKNYGKDFSLNFHGTRSTPTVVEDHVYIESGMGAVYCLNAQNGEEIWSIDFIADLGVDSVIQFGYSESVLIDGDKLFCVPGGKKNNVVALNRFTGELLWSSDGNGEIATYNSPILVNHNGLELIIAMTSGSVMGIDAQSGEMYWSMEQTQRNKIHANTPIYANGRLVVSSADPSATSGLVQLELSEDGKSVTEIWRNKKFRNLMGGLVKKDSCLYGSAYLKKDWQVINWYTGEQMVQNKELGGGSIIYADNRFYCYAERDGEIALVKASSNEFSILGKFKVPLGTKEHWARPVIKDGVLYIRHGDAIMAYNISYN